VRGNLGDAFFATADANPSAEAVVTGGVRLTYRELASRVHRLTHVLAARGVGPDDRVGVLLRHGSEHLEVLLAAFALRAVPVNLNNRFAAGELDEVITDSRARWVVHEADLGPLLPGSVPDDGRARLARGAAYEAALAAAPDTPLAVPGRSGDDRYVLYTGGTTRRPKGVVWRHADLRAAALAPADAEFAGRRVLVSAPLYHGTGQWMALATLLAGGTVVLGGTTGGRGEPLWDLASAERVSHLVVVGDVYVQSLVEALDHPPAGSGGWALDALTVILSGGASLTPSLTRRLLDHLPTAMVVDGYGATETGGHARCVSVAGARSLAARSPVFGVDDDTAVLDDDLRPIPPGDPTEGWLARRGPLPLGYDGDPVGTAETFPVLDGTRWAIPGDRARWVDEARVEILGRDILTVITGGEKVHVEEVASVLREHPQVADAVVVGAPDARWGELVTAVVQPAAGSTPSLDDLAEHCRGQLASFKVPRRLVLVDEVRRTGGGKPDYRWARSTVG
jgi:acyl-CoA synthetase (AMP-forming)/AMP-acid ligase II